MSTTVAAALAIAEVVVFEDRARVIRRGRVTVAAGQARLEVAPVAAVVIDKSVLVRLVGGPAQVLDVRVRREVAPWRTDGADPRAAAAERVALQERLDLARARRRALADRAAAATTAAQGLTGRHGHQPAPDHPRAILEHHDLGDGQVGEDAAHGSLRLPPTSSCFCEIFT